MKRVFFVLIISIIAVSFALGGCRGREKPSSEIESVEADMSVAPITEEAGQNITQSTAGLTVVETIPPTATPPAAAVKPQSPPGEKLTKDKEIQTALQAAGLYDGAIDGKIGPKTKKAIEDFQRLKGLKVDGKVGPKTWAELEKYLTQ